MVVGIAALIAGELGGRRRAQVLTPLAVAASLLPSLPARTEPCDSSLLATACRDPIPQLLGGLGAILCLVGLLFTIPCASAITAGVVAWYEQVMVGPSTASAPGSAV